MCDNIATIVMDTDTSETDRPWKCPKCNSCFSSEGHVRSHFHRVHPEFRLSSSVIPCSAQPECCNVCKKSFCSKKTLQKHQDTCNSQNHPNKCFQCGHIFSSKVNLVRHCRNVHLKEKKYVCDICQKRLTSKFNLIVHYRMHTDERPFVCLKCDASFAAKAKLQEHCLLHDKPFVCEVCKKSFDHKHLLQQHIIFHGNK